MARSLRKPAYAASFDVGEIASLLHDLEGRLAQLAGLISANARAARSALPDSISDAWSDVSERMSDVSERMLSNPRLNAIGREATRMGTGVWHKVEDEVVERPLLALAVAVGIGFLIGALNKRP